MENKRRNQLIRLIRMVLLTIMIVCLIQIGRAYYLLLQHRAQQKELEKITEIAELMQAEEKEQISEEKPNMEDLEQEEEEPVLLARYVSLYEKNKDLVGWLKIEGTQIDYPVVRGMDYEYYLHHNFYGDEDKYGCLFVKEIADVDTPGTNFVIYGHNMKDGAMFGELDLYQKEDFWKEHPIFSFDTLYEERSYEIAAVFSHKFMEMRRTFLSITNFMRRKRRKNL